MDPHTRPRQPISFDHRRALPSAPKSPAPKSQSEVQKRISTEPESSSVQSSPRPRKKVKHRGEFVGKVKRNTSVYDACAGQIGTEGQISTAHPTPLSPEEILYQRKTIQKRFDSFEAFERAYFDAQSSATDPRTGETRLPDSDLLVAIFEYARQFYASIEESTEGERERGMECWGSLNGSALIAMGILLEEMCKAELGVTSGLAMMEGARADLGMSRSGERLTIVGGRQVRDVITRKVVRSRSGSRDRGGGSSRRARAEESEADHQDETVSDDD